MRCHLVDARPPRERYEGKQILGRAAPHFRLATRMRNDGPPHGLRAVGYGPRSLLSCLYIEGFSGIRSKLGAAKSFHVRRLAVSSLGLPGRARSSFSLV